MPERQAAQDVLAPGEQPGRVEAADLIVAYLEAIGVEYVFGIPGGAVEPFYNALARSQRRGGLRPITARHETGAAFMADGYARETGKLGVCVATSGPGVTNLITGVACAYDNNVPLLVITGQPALPSFGRRAFQESGCNGVNVVSMMGHCTCYNSLVSHADQAETKLVNALLRASQMQRPAHLSFPIDVMRSPIPARRRQAYDLAGLMRAPALVDAVAVRELADAIQHARRIVVVVGGACAEAIGPIVELVELTGAQFVSTPDAKGLIDPHHRAYRGVFGFAGHRSADAALRNDADLIVAVGVSMGEWNSGAWSEAMLNDRLVHIDASGERLMRTPMARLHVQGHIRSTCARLVDMLRLEGTGVAQPGDRSATLAPVRAHDPHIAETAPLKPQRLMLELSRRCPPSVRFLADTGNSTAWAVHCLELQERRSALRPAAPGDKPAVERRARLPGWLRVVMDFAPMGWAIGAAVGVGRASPDCPVVCITGDGSYLMNGQEITVAAAEQLCVLFVVLNDGGLGMVKHGQRLTGAEPIAYELPQVDFRRMAEAMGVPGHVVESPADLDALDFAAIFARRGPTLLDVRIDPEEVPPLQLRTRSLANA